MRRTVAKKIYIYINILHIILTPWSRVLFEKLIVSQLVKTIPAFYGAHRSLPCWQEPATGPYRQPDQSSSHTHALFV